MRNAHARPRPLQRSRHASVAVASFAVAAVFVMGFAPSAIAYRPPTRALLDKAADRQYTRATKSVRVELETVRYDAGGLPRGAPVRERLLIVAPGSSRRETELASGTAVEIRAGDKVTQRTPDAADKSVKAPVDPFIDFLTIGGPMDADHGAERLLKDLKALGVNTEMVSLGRFDGRVAYLVGSKSWETDKAQFWIEKDTLLPIRAVWFTKDAEGKAVRQDLRYVGWGSAVGGAWFPGSIELWVSDKLVQRSVVKAVDRNVPVDVTLLK